MESDFIYCCNRECPRRLRSKCLRADHPMHHRQVRPDDSMDLVLHLFEPDPFSEYVLDTCMHFYPFPKAAPVASDLE